LWYLLHWRVVHSQQQEKRTMKMEQKVVTATSAAAFKEAVDSALKEGWRVIPGTVAVGGCGYVCFMEKPQQGPARI
jgi:hypothetical protein